MKKKNEFHKVKFAFQIEPLYFSSGYREISSKMMKSFLALDLHRPIESDYAEFFVF